MGQYKARLRIVRGTFPLGAFQRRASILDVAAAANAALKLYDTKAGQNKYLKKPIKLNLKNPS